MPLLTGKSQATVSANISELVKSPPSPARAKGIKTLAARRGISEKKAKRKQAIAIALDEAGLSRPKRRRSLLR